MDAADGKRAGLMAEFGTFVRPGSFPGTAGPELNQHRAAREKR